MFGANDIIENFQTSVPLIVQFCESKFFSTAVVEYTTSAQRVWFFNIGSGQVLEKIPGSDLSLKNGDWLNV